ncbi:unnamed protein product [Moneuplotes crassus]|uniref:Diacylglycerol O-acyltransferase n=1 Tax=Euplotes crassus TaxID=5936 RepID=A0AAD1UFW7_EUPCR|nr:unnamed protein product [Moneuplotes crassus]
MRIIVWALIIWLCGFAYSLVFLLWIRILIYLCAAYCLGLHPLSALDEAWLLDSKVNKCQPVCYVTFDKNDAKAIRNAILERLVGNCVRLRCCITRFLGHNFMKELPREEIEKCLEILDENEHHLHTEKDLGDFLSKTINDPIPLSTPQWRMWLYENYSETQSALLFKEHHVMADGLGILEIILLIVDEFKPEAIIDFRPTSWLKQMFLYLISPLFIFYYLIPILCKRRDRSSITNVPLSGERQFAIGKRFSLEDMKRSSRDLGVSMNDLAAGALSRGLAEYLADQKDIDHSKTLTAMVPVNLRTKKVRKPSDVKLQNNFTLVLLDFKMGQTLEDEIKRVNRLMKKAKSSIKPLTTMFIQQLIIRFLPLFITKPLMDYTAGKCTLAFSNVPGFKEDLTVLGSRANELLFFTPCMSKIGVGVSMVSHVDYFKMGISADTNVVKDPYLLLDKIEKNIQKCINLELHSDETFSLP